MWLYVQCAWLRWHDANICERIASSLYFGKLDFVLCNLNVLDHFLEAVNEHYSS